jgi:hypothetical protein
MGRAEELGRELSYACGLLGRAEEFGIRELSYADALMGRAEELGRELSYACGFGIGQLNISFRGMSRSRTLLGRKEESLGLRELSYAGGTVEELLESRRLSYALAEDLLVGSHKMLYALRLAAELSYYVGWLWGAAEELLEIRKLRKLLLSKELLCAFDH